uniref:FAD-binding PCMH-type domain-containing protein n=1 Tax=Anopheles epiroticus TaxID=199890 RepID=A0A240PPU5_9DIPT
MCLEGGCGACVVNVSGIHPVTKDTKTWSVNSCLFPVFACHGLDIKTVEALGNKRDGYHPIQERLAHMNGSQCGYCSPGMVMTMYSLLESKQGAVSMEEVENELGGNICRCTGYRPILDAFKSLASVSEKELPDIEELKICPKTNTACSAKCPAAASLIEPECPVHIVANDDREWHKVFAVEEIFSIFSKIGTKPYMLVGGNTAHGVYRRSEALKVFIDISSVEELRNFFLRTGELIVGANVTLTEFIEILNRTANNRPNFRYCREMARHVRQIANPAVRNAGTIAGNLCIKNQYPEFPSDLHVLLEAAGAELSVAESLIKSQEKTAQEFAQMDLSKKLLRVISLPLINSFNTTFRSYRVAPRAQNARAYVNAAFLLQLERDKATVKMARLCFGGINPQFTRASRTEKLLVGKQLFNNSTIQQAISTLTSELQPDWIMPDAPAEYRKGVAISFFYRFLLRVASDNNVATVNVRFRSGATMLQRPLSSGQQNYDTNKKNWPVTKYVPKLEGLAQASGEAKYSNDFPPFPGELYAAFVVATQPNATIGKIDPTEALKLTGTVAFYSAKDIPGTNNFMSDGMNFFFPDVEEIFCSGRVLFHGQPVGVIVAEQLEQAVRAAKLVKIIYERTSDEPIRPTIKAVLMHQTKDRIVDQPISSRAGPQAKVQMAQKLQGTLEMGGQYHYTLEPQTCVCVPVEDGMDIYEATQWVDLSQVAIAAALKVPENSLNFTVRRVGGGFGAKLTRASQIACACALAAHLSRRPVRFVMTIEANMSSIGKRYSCISNYQVEVDAKGTILKLTNNFMQDYGSNLNENVVDDAKVVFGLSYNSSSWKVEGKAVLTDSPSNTWMRAPGSTEGISMVETIMEHIAWVTGVDPMQVRMANMRAGSKLLTLMPRFRKDIEFDRRRKAVDDFNAKNRWRKRGIAMIPMQYPLVHVGALHAQVSVYAKDGTVSISHGGIEVGQGINTKAAQVAAFTLGIPLEKIAIKPTTSMTSPNAVMTGASMTSEVVCFAIIKACEILNARVKPVRDELKTAPWEKITQTCYTRDIDLSVLYQYKKADLKPYSIWGLSCAEIEVDVLTGSVQLTRVDILEDTGESMSPGIDVGQIEGAFVMGIGYWLTESLVYDMSTGVLLTNRTWTYKPPGAQDIPVDFRIRLIQTGDNPFGVLRSKATGEPAMTMSIVVLFALRYALRSAQKDAGRPDEWIALGSASTPDQIFLKACNTYDQYKLN